MLKRGRESINYVDWRRLCIVILCDVDYARHVTRQSHIFLKMADSIAFYSISLSVGGKCGSNN